MNDEQLKIKNGWRLSKKSNWYRPTEDGGVITIFYNRRNRRWSVVEEGEFWDETFNTLRAAMDAADFG